MPSIEIENESLNDMLDKHITLIKNGSDSEFPAFIDNTVKILQDVISNILIEISDKENETEKDLEVKEKRKKCVKDVVECFRTNFSYLIKNCFRTFTYVHTLSRNVQVNNELNKNKTKGKFIYFKKISNLNID